MTEINNTDVLIIGTGVAGARAALAACEKDVNCTIVTKGHWYGSNSTLAGLSVGVGDEWKVREDSKDIHLKDTIKGGDWINDQRLVKTLVEDISEEILFAERIGFMWEREEDDPKRYLKRHQGGHTYARSLSFFDLTGRALCTLLRGQLINHNVQIKEETMVTSLLTWNNSVVGATAIDKLNGDFIVFKAKSTILATGGCGHLYPVTTNNAQITGQGYALAYRAGAELADMEMIQFFPAGIIWPLIHRGILVPTMGYLSDTTGKDPTKYLRRLKNIHGERFLKKWDPERMEASTRDLISRAIWTEITEGRGTPHGGVYQDWTHIPNYISESLFPKHIIMLTLFGNDVRERPIEVAPTCHFFMGGIKVNERCETSLSGLYAAGETMRSIHGANRIDSNALPCLLVFGARAGKYAAESALKINMPQINHEQVKKEHERVYGIFNAKLTNGLRPDEIKKKIHRISYEYLFVVRNDSDLQKAISELKRIRNEDLSKVSLATDTKVYNSEWFEFLEVSDLLDVAEMVARAALMRTETRGAHARKDFPNRSEKWLKNVIIKRIDDTMTLQTEPVDFIHVFPPEGA